MQIKRRLFNRKTGEVKEVTEKVELVEEKGSYSMVKLKNGDIIRRKTRDIIK